MVNQGDLYQTILSLTIWIVSFIYLVLSLKNVYQQSAGWSLLKAFTILILYLVALSIGVVLVAIISFFAA